MQLSFLKSSKYLAACLAAVVTAGSGIQVWAADSLPPPSPAPDFRHAHSSSSLSAAQIDDLLRQGLAHEARGDTQQAERIFHHVLSLDPNNANAYYNLGVLDEKQRNLQGALYNYQRAARLNPNEVEFQQATVSVQSMLAPVLTVHNGPPPALVPTSETRQANAITALPPTSCEKPAPSKRSRVTRAVLGAAFAVGVSAAIGAASGRGMGGLHCPMCRIMRGGF